jgi:hypothetical protein
MPVLRRQNIIRTLKVIDIRSRRLKQKSHQYKYRYHIPLQCIHLHTHTPSWFKKTNTSIGYPISYATRKRLNFALIKAFLQ